MHGETSVELILKVVLTFLLKNEIRIVGEIFEDPQSKL